MINSLIYSKKRKKAERVEKSLLLALICFSFLLLGNLQLSYLGSGYSLTGNSLSMGEVESVQLTVITDNYPNEANPDLQTEWGVSMLLETDNLTLLLDTGLTPQVLSSNAEVLNKDLSEVDAVIISHEHGDHIGGLPHIAEVNPGVDVYLPSKISSTALTEIDAMGFNTILITETTVIYPGFAIIGELNGPPPYEHAFATNIKDLGLLVTVGCSHPGVENIVGKAVSDLNQTPYMVIGGFHMGSKSINETMEALIAYNVSKIFPIHCSGNNIRLYASLFYLEHYGVGNVGYVAVLDSDGIHSSSPKPNLYYFLIPVGIIVLIIPTVIIIQKKRIDHKKSL